MCTHFIIVTCGVLYNYCSEYFFLFSPASLPSFVFVAFPVASGNRIPGRQQLKEWKVFCGHGAEVVKTEA